MSRALFNDPDVAKKLKADFVTAGTGTEQLPYMDASVIEWFATAAEKAVEKAGYLEEWKKNPIYQGTYILGADGTAYLQVGDWEKDAFLKLLDDALREFRANPPRNVEFTKEDLAKGAKPGPPKSTSVIRLYSRCTPLPKDAHPVNRSIGRDHLWIHEDEVREIEETHKLPDRVAKRIARFHLVDNVRGLADAWAPEEEKHAFELSRSGKKYRITGTMSAEKDWPGDANYKGKLGIDGTLEAEFEIESGKIVRFRGIFEGKAWGANSNTWYQPKGTFPIVIAMIDTDDEPAVGPVWRDWGFDYDNPK